jgi:hypothetical protein
MYPIGLPTGALTSIFLKKKKDLRKRKQGNGQVKNYLQPTGPTAVHTSERSTDVNDFTFRVVQDSHLKGTQFAQTKTCAKIVFFHGVINGLSLSIQDGVLVVRFESGENYQKKKLEKIHQNFLEIHLQVIPFFGKPTIDQSTSSTLIRVDS